MLTIATAYAQNVQQLLWLRFISGIGLGSIMPNATALVGEFSPKRSRVTLMMCITVGFTIGAAVAGFVAAWLIPAFGWRSVFIFGGAVPFVIAIAMWWGLPESLQFLAVRGAQHAALAKWLKQLDPSLVVTPQTRYVSNEDSKGGVPFVHLFREGRAATTLLLWVVNFMNIMMLYSLSNWLPTVVTGMGYTQQTAVLVGTAMQVGGTIGTFGLAWLIARGGFIPTLTLTFAVAATSIAFIGHPALSLTALFVVVFIAGWCVIGGQPGHQRAVGYLLPHLPALDRRRRRPRRRPRRRHRRALRGRHPAGAAVVVAAAVLGRGAARHRLHHHHRDDGPADRPSARSARRTGEGGRGDARALVGRGSLVVGRSARGPGARSPEPAEPVACFVEGRWATVGEVGSPAPYGPARIPAVPAQHQFQRRLGVVGLSRFRMLA